jgi:hypothetical protein
MMNIDNTYRGACYHIQGVTCPNCAPKSGECPHCTPRCPHGYPITIAPRITWENVPIGNHRARTPYDGMSDTVRWDWAVRHPGTNGGA